MKNPKVLVKLLPPDKAILETDKDVNRIYRKKVGGSYNVSSES